MKYIYNPISGDLDETAKIDTNLSSNAIDSLNKFEDNSHIEEAAAQTQLEKLAIQKNHGGQLWKDHVAKNEKTEKLINSTILKNNINNKPIVSLDYINRVQALYGEAPLNESNKMKDTALAAANKRNGVDPNRPAFSDSDVVFAAMDPQEALRFTGGHNKEKIKFMREIKARVRAQDAYDEKKKRLANIPVRKEPIKDMVDVEDINIEPVRPNFTKPRDPDLDAGVASILGIKP